MAKLKRVKLAKTIVTPLTPSGRNELRDVEANVSGWGIAIPVPHSEDEIVIPWTHVEYVIREKQK